MFTHWIASLTFIAGLRTSTPLKKINLQYQALQQVVRLGDLYGVDVRKPAMNVKEAIQWVNIAFMAVCRVINGAATSLGRVPIVLDIFAERDLARGTLLNQNPRIC